MSNILRLLFIISLLFASACQRPEGPFRVGTNRWPGYEPLYLARGLGYFNGTPIRLAEYPSTTEVINAFRNGAIEAAALTLDEAFLLAQDKIDAHIVLVFDYSQGADVVMAHAGIKDIPDLKGRRIGAEITALGAYMLSRALQTGGLDLSDVEVTPMPVDEHERAFKERRVDAVVTFEPVRTKLIAAGGRIIFDSSLIPGEIIDVLVVRGDVLEKRPGVVRHVLQKWFDALEYLKKEPEDAAGHMAKRLGFSGGEFLESLKGIKIPDFDENRRMLEGREPGILGPARRLMDRMLQSKLLREPVDPGRLIEPRPLKDVRP